MEVKINKEIRDYTDTVAWGLSAREAFFSFLAIILAGALYFALSSKLGDYGTLVVIVVVAGPVGIAGFAKYNGMYIEQLALAVIRTLKLRKPLVWKSVSAYKKMEDYALAEAKRDKTIIKVVSDKEKSNDK